MKIKEFIKSNYKWIIAIICLIGFIALAEDVWENELMKGDVIGYNFVSKYLINDKLTQIIKVITNFGGAYVLICIDAILSIIFLANNKKDLFLEINLNLVIISLLNSLLKNILQRPRPEEYRIVDASGYSFPSGHSMISMAFYGFFIYLIFKNVKNKYVKWISIIILLFLILSIGVSRIYLGVHYTSDVLAGFLISIAHLCAFTAGINKIKE